MEQNNTSNNAVLAEKIKSLRAEFTEYKKENKGDLRELEKRVTATEAVTQRIDQTMGFMNDTLKEMKNMMNVFTEKFSEKIDTQNEVIDEFINSDKRRDSKRNLIVSVAQVIGGMIVAIIGLWASGKL